MFSWKKRFFTLKSNGDLVYYETTSSTQSLGMVPISAAAICSADPKNSVLFTVQAAQNARKYYGTLPSLRYCNNSFRYCMKADNAEDCSAWVSKISV